MEKNDPPVLNTVVYTSVVYTLQQINHPKWRKGKLTCCYKQPISFKRLFLECKLPNKSKKQIG